MAKDLMDKVVEVTELEDSKGCQTDGYMLEGGDGWYPTLFIRLVQDYGLDIDVRMYSIIHIPYSWKYWRELNSAVEPKIAIARILADLNLAVRYGIAIHIYIYASRKFWRILIWRL